MRRTLLDAPDITALCNIWKRKHILTKLYLDGVWFKGTVLEFYRTSFFYLIQFGQINIKNLSDSLTHKSANLMNCFSRSIHRLSFISFYFGVNYKPINKNDHETDAFGHFLHFFCAW